jgi:hypothetical protein
MALGSVGLLETDGNRERPLAARTMRAGRLGGCGRCSFKSQKRGNALFVCKKRTKRNAIGLLVGSVVPSFRAPLSSTEARDPRPFRPSGCICLALVILRPEGMSSRGDGTQLRVKTEFQPWEPPIPQRRVLKGRQIEKTEWQNRRAFETKDSITGTMAGPSRHQANAFDRLSAMERWTIPPAT